MKADGSHRADVIRLLSAQMGEHAIPTSEAKLARAVDGIFEDPARGAIFVALFDGKAAGVAYLAFTWTAEHGGKSAWLEELYVAPEYRGAGLGAKLLGEALDFARRDGCAAVDLEVEADHERVESLYRRNGFRPRTRARWVHVIRKA